MIGNIYKITNLINNKKYVGMTLIPIVDRWLGHVKSSKSNSNLLLHKAIRKHGVENFTVELIESCDVLDVSSLGDREILHIDLEKSFVGDHPDLGYNMTRGGEYGVTGYCHTDETKRKISASLVGENNPFFGRKHSIESIEKMRQKLIDHVPSSTARKNMSLAGLGRPNSIETNDKIANSNRGKKRTVEQRKRMCGTRGRAGAGKPRCIEQLTLTGDLIKYHPSIKAASLAISRNGPAIWKCCVGINKSCAGYMWRYASVENRE